MAFVTEITNKECVSTSGLFKVFVRWDTDVKMWGYEV
jgi:hypothetical protein